MKKAPYILSFIAKMVDLTFFVYYDPKFPRYILCPHLSLNNIIILTGSSPIQINITHNFPDVWCYNMLPLCQIRMWYVNTMFVNTCISYISWMNKFRLHLCKMNHLICLKLRLVSCRGFIWALMHAHWRYLPKLKVVAHCVVYKMKM